MEISISFFSLVFFKPPLIRSFQHIILIIVNLKEETPDLLPKNMTFSLGSDFIDGLTVFADGFARINSALGDGFAFFLNQVLVISDC